MRAYCLGGKGKKAPYTTKTIRVPEPLIDDINLMIEVYQDRLSENDCDPTTVSGNAYPIPGFDIPPLEKTLEIARKIKRQKKSASKSLVSLLRVLYDTNSITEDNIK